MIGEETVFPFIIHKSGMDGTIHGGEANVIATILKDSLQTVGLIFGIAEDLYAVTFRDEIAETIGNEIEILMVKSLGGAAEIDRHVGCKIGRLIARTELHRLHLRKTAIESRVIHHLLHRFRVALLGNQSRCGEAFLPYRLDT